MAKRDSQQNIQAWFDSADNPETWEQLVSAYYAKLRERGWSPKEVIGSGILGLKSRFGDDPPERPRLQGLLVEGIPAPTLMGADERFNQIYALIERLTETIERGGLKVDAGTQAAMDQAKQQREEYSTMEQSLGGRYQATRFADDEEE